MFIIRKKDSKEIDFLGFERVVNFTLIMRARKFGVRNNFLKRIGQVKGIYVEGGGSGIVNRI